MFHFTGPYEYYTPPSKYISQEPTYQEHPYHQLVHKKPGIWESLKSTIFSKLGINRQSAIGNLVKIYLITNKAHTKKLDFWKV